MVNMVASGDKYLFRLSLVITFTVALLFFSIIFSLHFMIQDNTESDCVLKLGNEILYELNRGINSKSTAKKVIEAYAQNSKKNADMQLLEAGLESCGFAYLFIDKTDNVKYAVCENGKMYQYKKICKS